MAELVARRVVTSKFKLDKTQLRIKTGPNVLRRLCTRKTPTLEAERLRKRSNCLTYCYCNSIKHALENHVIQDATESYMHNHDTHGPPNKKNLQMARKYMP